MDEPRNEKKLKKAFARSGMFGKTGPSHEGLVLKQYDHLQKTQAFAAHRARQKAAVDRHTLQAESDRLRMHMQTNRLHGNHGVVARLANLRRILGELNDHPA